MATLKNMGGKPKLIRSYWTQPGLAAGWTNINLPFEVDPDRTLILGGGWGYYAWIKHNSAAYTPPDGTMVKLNSNTQAAVHCHSTYASGNLWVPLYFLWWPNAVVERGLSTFSSANAPAVTKSADVALAQTLPSDKVANQEVLGFIAEYGGHTRNTAGYIVAGGWQLEVKNENTITVHWMQTTTAGSLDMPWQVIYWK